MSKADYKDMKLKFDLNSIVEAMKVPLDKVMEATPDADQEEEMDIDKQYMIEDLVKAVKSGKSSPIGMFFCLCFYDFDLIFYS